MSRDDATRVAIQATDAQRARTPALASIDACPLLGDAQVVLLAEPDGSEDALAAAYAAVREQTAAPVLVLAREPLDSDVLERAARRGAFDVIDPSTGGAALHFAIERAALLDGAAAASARASATADRDLPRLVSVLAVRGGAGSTMLAVNVAAAKARVWARDVLLLDLDLDGADVALACGVDPEHTITDLIQSHGDIDWLKLRSHLLRAQAGFSLLPGSRWPGEARNVRPELLLDVVAAARGHADVVVADLPQSFTAPTLAALERTDALVLVLTPEVASIRHTVQALQQLDRLGFDAGRVRIVLNRLGAPGMLTRQDVEHAIARHVDIAIPDDSYVAASLNAGVPLVQRSPGSPATRAILELCELLGEPHEPGPLHAARRHLLRRRALAGKG